MRRLLPWLEALEVRQTAPLFQTEMDGLTVQTHQRGREGDRRTLTRHPAFDHAMITMVEVGLADPRWRGFLYVMFTGQGEAFVPRYIGKAEKRGNRNELSANLLRLRQDPSKFGRWGYNAAYHVGDLSHALFGEEFRCYRPHPTASYRRWAQTLFEQYDPPKLRAPVWVTLIPWWEDSRGASGLIGSVAAVEYELIALAAAEYGEALLNRQSR